jgi:predicted  nucleic acid-binding Zn-ribbon protein
LDRLAEDIESKEATIDHLQAQRETLLDNYVKAQKLALVLWVNQHKLGLHQALKKWSDYAKSQRNIETKELLKNNLASLEILKQRIKQLEGENELVASENEDLRQFSLDGYDIAKNV